MIAAPRHGFTFFAMPKAASTSIEAAFGRHSQVQLRGAGFKHMNVRQFERRIAPLLKASGYPRDSYETVCLIRHPVDWLMSWWRYRSRAQLADPSSPMHHHYVGDLSFDEFAIGVVEGRIALGRPSRFTMNRKGRCGIDRMYKYEHLEECRLWLCEKIGEDVRVKTRNVSPPREDSATPEVVRRLEQELARDFELYRSAH